VSYPDVSAVLEGLSKESLKERKGKRGSYTPFLNISDTKRSLAEARRRKH
jgi:hypothetical protein